MQTKYFSPSINILRDQNADFHYIPTRNGERAFQKIASAFEQGTKSFNIIGAYGSGKSAFIVALEKTLNKKAKFFNNPLNGQVDNFETTFIIGEYTSFKQVFCEAFELNQKNDLLKELRKLFEEKAKSKIGQLIVIDEFGKFLEYAAKESPEEELYFIQQLAELFNTPQLPIFFITTLHQAFEDYALALTTPQKKEWDKVKGRLIEISFNEPVEQLLFLASERISQKMFPCFIGQEQQKLLFQTIQEADVFPMRDYFSFEFAQKLFPFDILSASLVIIAFQRYGQNERSLFSFLESEDYLGLNDFTGGNEFYHIPHIYDYLKYNFHSLLNSRYNPDSAQWKAMDEAIQRAETIFDQEFNEAAQIVKTVGLISILGRHGQKITKEFLKIYSENALAIENAEIIIEKLESKQIIRYRSYSQRYVLFRGTDFDLNTELELADNQVTKDFSIVHQLQKHFNFPIIPAKRIFFEKGTPRYFVFEITENAIEKEPEEQVDGFINLIFNKQIKSSKVKELSSSCDKAILYGLIKNVDEIQKQIIEIEKAQIAKGKCVDDHIATAELDTYLEFSRNQLNSMFHDSFFGKSSNVDWFYNGRQKYFKNSREMNLCLSQICEEVYPSTPVLRNELMNREKVSGTISSARKNLIDQLLRFVEAENLGFDENRFPPEKTIYLTLLHKTGIHQIDGEHFVLGNPTDRSFTELWQASVNFLNSCSQASRKITEFIDILKSKPFKLKQGFIDFWIPIFLIANQKQFAFYEIDEFIPHLSTDTLEVAMKQPQKYRISTFHLDEVRINIFNRYRYFLNMVEENTPNSDTFIETVKPFLVFYKNLVPFTKQTKNLSKNALRLREAISLSTDPEKIFFEEIPRALKFTINDFSSEQELEDFTIALKEATRELSSAFPNLVNRIEEVISKTVGNEQIGFPENKLALQQRFKKLKQQHIDAKLRVLIQRINTPLDDRQSWINSIASVTIDKSLDSFSDNDEKDFASLFQKRIHDLDNLTDISKKDIDETKEEVLKLELTSFVKGVQRNLIRLSKEKSKEIDLKKLDIQKMLDKNDKRSNIALLIKLLQEEIENE